MKKLQDKLQEYFGEYIAIRCSKYSYRGKVIEIGEDFVVLEKAHVVEIEGHPESKETRAEACTGTIVLPFTSVKSHKWSLAEGVECIFKPRWADAKCSACERLEKA